MLKTALILVAAAAAAPAVAAQPASATVTVSAADFASARSRAELGHRIRNAIELVCGSYSTSEVRDWSQIDGCWKTARAQAARTLAAVQGDNSVRLSFR